MATFFGGEQIKEVQTLRQQVTVGSSFPSAATFLQTSSQEYAEFEIYGFGYNNQFGGTTGLTSSIEIVKTSDFNNPITIFTTSGLLSNQFVNYMNAGQFQAVDFDKFLRGSRKFLMGPSTRLRVNATDGSVQVHTLTLYYSYKKWDAP